MTLYRTEAWIAWVVSLLIFFAVLCALPTPWWQAAIFFLIGWWGSFFFNTIGQNP